MTDGQRRRWEDFFSALPSWAPGAPLPGSGEVCIEKRPGAAWPGSGVGHGGGAKEIHPCRPRRRRPLRELVPGIIGAEFARRLEMTRGIFAILRGYEAVYDGTVRRLGRLTFADLQRLLLSAGTAGARPLSREATDDARLFIDWRLDAQIDHWLLDEFQDTSFGQWRVLGNLIDEAVQDPSGTRSFFYVGDVKQAIFAWREGDAGLFREIFDHYNAGTPGTIGVERLDRSYRSGRAVIAMVQPGDGGVAARR